MLLDNVIKNFVLCIFVDLFLTTNLDMVNKHLVIAGYTIAEVIVMLRGVSNIQFRHFGSPKKKGAPRMEYALFYHIQPISKAWR